MLNWTTEKPKVPGNYWMHVADQTVFMRMMEEDLQQIFHDCLWCGPVANAFERPSEPLDPLNGRSVGVYRLNSSSTTSTVAVHQIGE
jgi:hypothetical protein